MIANPAGASFAGGVSASAISSRPVAAIYLPDTNVFCRYLRGVDVGIKAKLEANVRFCRLSSVVLSELEYRAARRADLPSLLQRVEKLRTIIVDEVDYTCANALYYGAIRAHLAQLKPNALPKISI